MKKNNSKKVVAKKNPVSKFLKSLKINESFDTNSKSSPNTKSNQTHTGMYPWQSSAKPLPSKMLRYI